MNPKFSKGPSTHGEEFVDKYSTNTQRIVDHCRVFAGKEIFTFILINLIFVRMQVQKH